VDQHRTGVMARNGGRRARLLTAPAGVMPYCLSIEATALIVTVTLPWRAVAGQEWLWFGLLTLAGMAQAELSARVEKVRRHLATGLHVNMTSVWFFAAALTLPPILAALLVILNSGHLWLRVWRALPGRPVYRVVCTTAMMINAVQVVQVVVTTFGDRLGAAAIVAGGLAYLVVNLGQVLGALKLEDPEASLLTPSGALWNAAILELTTLCLGGVTAVLLTAHPGLVWIMVLPVVVLPQGVLGRVLEQRESRDHKTGLLTVAEWERRADAELDTARRTGGVASILMIDIDHFKRVNDTYGHLAGDAALATVATAVRGEVRVYDSVGRFGGEEFVVLLAGLDSGQAAAVAERIREAVTKLTVQTGNGVLITGLSVSVGVATCPMAGTARDTVLSAADKAVYEAKQFGRNQVRQAALSGGCEWTTAESR
jgi:diguanylate cyclase (GGDEF)-like protein